MRRPPTASSGHRDPLDGRRAARPVATTSSAPSARSAAAPTRSSPAQVALVRALADHAAAAMANARLIEELDQSRVELAERADVERSLREIAARISAATDLPAVLQGAVDEAARLLDADGARIDLVDRRSNLLLWRLRLGRRPPRRGDVVAGRSRTTTLEQGIVRAGRRPRAPVWTGDYLDDPRFPHGEAATPSSARAGVHSVMAAPLIGEGGPFGALTVFTDRQDAWGETDAAAAGRHRRPGGHHHHHDPAHRRARPVARGARPPRRGGAGAARDRRPDHRAARHDRDPRGRRRAGGPPGRAPTASSSTSSTRRPATCTGRSTAASASCSPTRSGPSCGSTSGSARPGPPSPRTAWSSRSGTWRTSSRPRPIDRVLRADRASAR